MVHYVGYFILIGAATIFYSGISTKGRWFNFRYILCLSPLLYVATSSISKEAFHFDLSWNKKIQDKNEFYLKEKTVVIAIIASICMGIYQKRSSLLPFLTRNIFLLPLIFIALFLLYDQFEQQKTKKWI